MCTGRPPFRAPTTLAVLKRVAEDTPRPIREIIPEMPDWLCAIITKLHAKKPDERFASAKEVADLLEHCLTELQQGRTPKIAVPEPSREPVSLPPPKPTTAAQQGRSHQPAAVTAAAVALVLLIGLGISEATGVTKLTATVIRISTGSGTLVIEIDDPGISVSINGEELVITGGGVQEIRLKPGQYKVLASKDGKLVTQELVTVTRGGRQVVRVSKESQPAVTDVGGPSEAVALPARFTNTLGMEFALVPKGKSWLGGGGGKPGDQEVEFKEDFYLGVYEVTQEEWHKVTETNPGNFTAVAGVKAEDQQRFPVESVSWNDAQDFIKLLNEKANDSGWEYRLPTEAEWEYACRGGPLANRLQSAFDFYLEEPTNTLLPGQANFHGAERALNRPCKVGSYRPNKLGLFDMHGNVVEWCQDQQQDANGVTLRMIRGGCWGYDALSCRASRPNGFGPTARDHHIGLRLARVPRGTSNPTRYTNSLGMEFALVPAGKAWLGAVGGKPGDKEVEFKEDFYLGVYEVTQEEWEGVAEGNPSRFSRNGLGKDLVKDIPDAELKRFPVESVSWDDVQLFLEALNRREKTTGWLYRLPTEEEWEYACRGGPASDKVVYAFDFYFEKPTNQLLPDQANFNNAVKRTCEVGSYHPNKLGLHDMHGNVGEWCHFQEASGKTERRLVRGGFWSGHVGYPHAGFSNGAHRTARLSHLGLRVARAARRLDATTSLHAAPFDEKQAKQHQEQWAKYLARNVVEENNLGMKLTLIPPGRFTMGNADTAEKVGKDFAGTDEERPGSTKCISRGPSPCLLPKSRRGSTKRSWGGMSADTTRRGSGQPR